MKIKVRKYRVVVENCDGLIEEREGAYYGSNLKRDVKQSYKKMGYNVLMVKILERGYKELGGVPNFYDVNECIFKEDEYDG